MIISLPHCCCTVAVPSVGYLKGKCMATKFQFLTLFYQRKNEGGEKRKGRKDMETPIGIWGTF